MITHVVLRAFIDKATSEQIEAVEQRTRRFAELPGVLSVTAGPNVAISPKHEGLTHGAVISVADVDALKAFFAHPEHVAAAQNSGPLTARVVIFDIETPG